jgi:hypothetical protein
MCKECRQKTVRAEAKVYESEVQEKQTRGEKREKEQKWSEVKVIAGEENQSKLDIC